MEPSPADRNVISGNGQGVRIVASSNNIIQGNYIGVEPDGWGAPRQWSGRYRRHERGGRRDDRAGHR